MVTHNVSRYVEAAVQSILNQTFDDFELVIVDDGSTDRTVSILRLLAARDSRIRLFEMEKVGLVRARIESLAHARGEFCAVMDADDVSLPQRFEKHLAYLQAHPQCVAVGCRIRSIDPDGCPIADETWRPTDHEAIVQMLMSGSGALPHPGSMIRRDAMIAAGGYRGEFELSHDLDLWLRLSEIGELANLGDVLIEYRQHYDSVSVARRARQIELAERAVRDAYARRGIDVPSEFEVAGARPRNRFELHQAWARDAKQAGHVRSARKHAWAAWIRRPLDREAADLLAECMAGDRRPWWWRMWRGARRVVWWGRAN